MDPLIRRVRVGLISSQKMDSLRGNARRCRLLGMTCDINDLASDELGTPLHGDAQKSPTNSHQNSHQNSHRILTLICW